MSRQRTLSLLLEIFLVAALFVCVAYAMPQREGGAGILATASVDKTEIFIGDEVRYEIIVTASQDTEVVFPQFAENLGGFGIKDFGGSKKKQIFKRQVLYTQWYILDTYVTGSYQIPPCQIKYKTKTGEEGLVSTGKIAIEVKSILELEGQDAQDIKDIKPPLTFARNIKLQVLAGIVILLLATGLWIFFAMKRGPVRKILLPKPAQQIAYEQLQRLKDEDLIKKGLVKEYYFRLSSIVRQYLENRFNLRAPEMTTEEFLVSLSDSDKLDGELKGLLSFFLSEADLVKFAKYGPSEKEIASAFDSAKNLIDRTRQPQTV